jgi:glycosyltransferase involved in cell wall biosynthesis
MIKILHLIKSLGRGGAEVLLPETLKLHNNQIFEFHYIYFLPWKNQMVSEIEEAGGIVLCIPAKNNLAILLQYKKVKQYIIKHQISLIHCHLPITGILGRMLFSFNKSAVIYTEHNKQERYHLVTRLLNRITFHLQSQVVAVSRDVAQSIRSNINPRLKLNTMLNGVNTIEFRRDKYETSIVRKTFNIDHSTIVVGAIAVFRTQKRLKEWLQVFKVIHDTYPNTRAIIVGDGLLRSEIEKCIQQLQLQEVVFLAGLQKNVRPWLFAMDIFLMSSEFEGLPIALLEAMSMQCAIVSTNAGGIKEVIRNDIDGLIVPVDQWEKLSDCVLKLVRSPDLLSDMKTKARSRVEASFSIERMVFDLENLYKAVVIENPKS